MALNKVPYVDGVTVITAENLNDIQDAIIALENAPAQGLTEDMKQALLQIARKVAYIDDQGQTYYDDLYDAFYPPKTVVLITAVFEQGSTVIYDDTALDDLKQYLTVTAKYDDNTTAILADSAYTLSGLLEAPSSTVTVIYSGVSTTFSVAVTARPTLSSISAVYTQSGTVYTDDTLDSLKTDLVVTANYSDSSTQTVPAADYTLSGTLTAGTSTITVAYGGKTTTFTVTVVVNGWLYHFDQSLLSSGSEDFGLTGNAVYTAGRLGTDYAYSHIVPTSGTASSDTQLGLSAIGLSNAPSFSGDFTLSFWMATQVNYYCHPYTQSIFVASDSLTGFFTGVSVQKQGWGAAVDGGTTKAYSGLLIQGSASGKLIVRFANADLTKGNQFVITYPAEVDTTQWHHYALTRKGNNIRFFFDGELIATAVSSETVYDAGQVAISANFNTASLADKSTVQQMPNGEKMQDLYVAEFCKWESSFDSSAITY